MSQHGHDGQKSDHNSHGHGHHEGEVDGLGHPILKDSTAVKVYFILLFFTALTVGMSHVNMGAFNMLLVLAVAATKATLVCLFFMELKNDNKQYAVIFSTSFLFLAIFIVLTGTDLFFRGDVYLKKGEPIFLAVANAGPKMKEPWTNTPELVAKGKELFGQNCVSCHGEKGEGNGVAAAALNPKPRNFTQTANWINGRKPSQIFKTLSKGVNQMPSFASLPSDCRWELAHFITTLGPSIEKDDQASILANAGVDISKGDAGSSDPKSVPIDFAVQQILKERGTSKN